MLIIATTCIANWSRMMWDFSTVRFILSFLLNVCHFCLVTQFSSSSTSTHPLIQLSASHLCLAKTSFQLHRSVSAKHTLYVPTVALLWNLLLSGRWHGGGPKSHCSQISADLWGAFATCYVMFSGNTARIRVTT